MTQSVQIREVVTQALDQGFLSIEAENTLRQLLSHKYEREDLNAFMVLQHAAMNGQVRQESRLAH
ncbi:MAG: hypothetical protein HC860_00925 [Alkalinema sp. RU_4_3]|nr:hypothetical protein [Alkalinema sp. RU_4_3]